MLAEGTLLRWIDPRPGAQPLGIVIPPLSADIAYVLMATDQGALNLEIFVARLESTGVDASAMVLEQMEPANDAEWPDLGDLLRIAGPGWWLAQEHNEGFHVDTPHPDCLLCGGQPG